MPDIRRILTRLPSCDTLLRGTTALLIVTSLSLLLWWIMAGSETGRMPGPGPNHPLGHLLLGLALAGVAQNHRYLRWIAFLPALLGLLSLIELAWGLDLGINAIIPHRHDLTVDHRNALAAFALLIGGIALSPLGAWRSGFQPAILGLGGAFALAAGLAPALCGLFELTPHTDAGTIGMGIRMPMADIALLLICGAGLTLGALHAPRSPRASAASWIPIPVIVTGITFSLLLWSGLRQRESQYIATSLDGIIANVANAANLSLERQINSLERLARDTTLPPPPEDKRTLSLLTEALGGLRLVWTSTDGTPRFVVGAPSPAGRPFAEEERAAAFEKALRNHETAIAFNVRVSDALNGFSIACPILRSGILRSGQPTGLLVGDYDYVEFFEDLLKKQELAGRYTLSIEVGSLIAYQEGTEIAHGLTRSNLIPFRDRPVRLTVALTEAEYRRAYRSFPELVLLAGLGITLLTGISLHLARSARASLQAAESSNRRLLAENEERRRTDASLKLSDARLRLALETSQIGIFEWFCSNDRLHISSGIWNLLGYPPNQVPASLSYWRSLIHPEDLPAFSHVTELAGRGTDDVAQTEFRVRTSRGAWRWFYLRTRALAQTSSALGTRIIGTLQDITDRMNAEQALRASQADARKLALVASRTDNLVVIASPRGDIEWINESFTRALGYTLGEIAGAGLEDVLIGPGTSPVAGNRIRGALRRGESIDGDITNLSKDGRLYHLHLEIQPVHDEAGQVQNLIAILVDITERVDNEIALRRAKAEADAASRTKSEFLAAMSHEIRTPMNGVMGMTSLLLETALSRDQRECVTTIRNSGEALLAIINDILDFSKAESGRMELETLPFELGVCIEETLDLFSGQASAKQLDLAYAIDPAISPWIEGDANRLRQVLANLVNNAVKFTPAGSVSIEVTSHPELPDRLVFAITDTGIGIPKESIGLLFQPFSQVDSSTTRKFGGTGLGLAICDRLCRLMGGGITVESSFGAGSTFRFDIRATVASSAHQTHARPSLPADLVGRPVLVADLHPVNRRRFAGLLTASGILPVVAADAAEAARLLATHEPAPAAAVLDAAYCNNADLLAAIRERALPVVWLQSLVRPGTRSPFANLAAPALPQPSRIIPKPVRSTHIARELNALFATAASAEDSAPPVAAPIERLADIIPLRILLVEDNLINQKVATRFLERIGYRADTALNGLEALAALDRAPYDLVFMDLHMPEMDGFEASRHIRARIPADLQPKIVALTANILDCDRESCLAVGIDDYVSKPLRFNDLTDVIRRQFAPPVNDYIG